MGNCGDGGIPFAEGAAGDAPLVSYGRMGLTNYIAQSVIGVFIFPVSGWIGAIWVFS